MGRSCTICTHPDREAIEHALVGGESSRSISSRYGTFGRMALHRHKAHIPPALAKAQEAQEVARAGGLLDQVRALQDKALGILTQAEQAGDLRVALGAIREARSNLELLAKLVGELRETPEAQATAQVLVVTVDGKAVESEAARRAAARALLERFSVRRDTFNSG